MKERFTEFMRSEGLTPTQLAQILEIQTSNVSHFLSGRSKPSFDVVDKMLKRFPQLSPDWFIGGVGEMYRNGGAKNLQHKECPSIPHEDEKRVPNLFETISTENFPPKSTAEKSISADIFMRQNPDIEYIMIFYKDKTFKIYRPQ